MEAMTGIQLRNPTINIAEAYPQGHNKLLNISTISCKEIREGKSNLEESIICTYKIGLILQPGEVLSWTKRMKSLTSTRHKNILLRAAHGDIFSNSRLFKFRLRDSPSCLNCQEPIDTIQHRLLECPKAAVAWSKLDEAKLQLGLTPLTNYTRENILGAGERRSKLELALQAELILRLSTKSESYDAATLVKTVVTFVCNAEHLTEQTKEHFKRFKRDN